MFYETNKECKNEDVKKKRTLFKILFRVNKKIFILIKEEYKINLEKKRKIIKCKIIKKFKLNIRNKPAFFTKKVLCTTTSKVKRTNKIYTIHKLFRILINYK